MTYDKKCHDLAKAFIDESNVIDKLTAIDELAQEIQTLVEDKIRDIEYVQDDGRAAYEAAGAKRRMVYNWHVIEL